MKKKIISLAMLTMLLSLLVVPTVFAQPPEQENLTKDKIEIFLEAAKDWVGLIVGIIGVIVIIVAAIRYMMAGGDEEKVANAKKTLVGGVIGVALAIIAWGIFGLVASFLRGS